VVQLRIPPLRERAEDILPLAEYFGARYAAANGLAERPLAVAATARLLAHLWPGNVRELENAMHRAVLLASGREIGLDAIELGTTPAPTQPSATAPTVPVGITPIAALVGRRMEEVERELILETLGRCLGNRTRAAEILGISIRTLRNKLAEYRGAGLSVPPAPGVMPENWRVA